MSKHPTLVHVVPSLQTGGLEVLLERLLPIQAKRWSVHVACLYAGGEVADRIRGQGVGVHVLQDAVGHGSRLLSKVAALLRRLQPEIVHSHNLGAHFHSVLSYPVVRPRAIVHTRHGQHSRTDRIGRLVNRLSARWTSAAIAVSADVAKILVEGEEFPRNKVHVLRNAVDVDAYRPSCGSQKQAIAVGRLHPLKDFPTLLKATALVTRRHPDFHLRIVGDGEDADHLVQLRSDLGLDEVVEFMGRRDDVSTLLTQSGLYVLSSVSEGLPLTILEAMASQLPIVSTNVGGIPEVIKQGVHGLLVDASSPEALSEAMIRLIDDAPMAAKLAQAARNRAWTEHSITQLAAQYETIYSDVAR